MKKLTLIVLAINNLVLGAAVWVLAARLADVELMSDKLADFASRMVPIVNGMGSTVEYLYFMFNVLLSGGG